MPTKKQPAKTGVGETSAQPLRLEYRTAAELEANPKNWRKHPRKQLDALRDVIAEVGWAGVILYNEATGRMVDGHARKEVSDPSAKVPVLIGSWTEEQEAKILATLDPLASMATADTERLDSLLRSVQTGSEHVGEMLKDLGRKAGCAWAKEEKQADDVPPDEGGADEAQEKWNIEIGDEWLILGQSSEHRLVCGDSSDPAMIAVCLAGRSADVVVLDPPFELAESKWLPHLFDPCILFGQAKHVRAVPGNLWRFERLLVKPNMHRSSTVHIGHRHAFVAQCGTIKTCPTSSETFDSVVMLEREIDFEYAKPVSILIDHLTNWTPPWDVVFDPFAGSGSTILAAERMGKAACAIEIDPARVALILERCARIQLKCTKNVRNMCGKAGRRNRPADPEHTQP